MKNRFPSCLRSVSSRHPVLWLLVVACAWWGASAIAQNGGDEPCGEWFHQGWTAGDVTWTVDGQGNPTATISNATEHCGWSDPCEGTTENPVSHSVPYTKISEGDGIGPHGYQKEYIWRADPTCVNGSPTYAFAQMPYTRVWDIGAAIKDGNLTLPANNAFVVANTTLNCAVSEASDKDHWTQGPGSGTADDSVRYNWTASGGSFDNATSRTPVWTAPANPGQYTLTCTIDDSLNEGETGVTPPDQGTRNDAPVTHSVSVTVTNNDGGQDITIEKLQYRFQGDTQWIDAPATLELDLTDVVEFQAVASPEGADWPAGKPVWSGTAPGASGTGPTKTLSFADGGGIFTLTAECNNTVTVNLAVACPPPPVEHCDGTLEGESCSTCGCTDIVDQEICRTASQYFLPTRVGPPIGFQLVYLGSTQTWSDNYNKKLEVDSDGKVKLKDPAGRTDTFNADGTGEPGDERKMVAQPDGSYQLVNPDGSKEIYRADANGELTLTEQQDALGNAVTITRGANGNLQKITAADGQELTVSRDADGRISGVSDGHTGTSVTYDANGRVATSTDVLGQTVSYTYDAQGRVLTQTDWRGTTHYTYEGYYEGGAVVGETGYSAPGQPMGYAKRTTIEHPDGSKEETFWDGYNTSWHVSPADYVEYTPEHNNASADVPKTIYKIETIAGQGRVTQVTDPLGNVTKTEYDSATGLVTKVTDALGHSVSTTYNAQGNPLVVTDADGKTTTFEYAANGVDVTKIKDSAGTAIATFTYDANHQVLSATDAQGHTTSTTYTSWGAVASTTDAGNITTTYNYDSTTKLLTSISQGGSTLASYTYDAQDRVASQTDATGMTVSYQYDAGDRVTKTTYPDGTYEEVSYVDCCGTAQAKPAWSKDRAGRTTTFTYDQMGQLTKVTDAAGNEVEYAYDLNGQLTQLKDTKDNATGYSYDAAGQLTKKTYADGTYEEMTYNAIGQLIGQRDAKNNVAAFEYDAAGRITKIDYPHDTDVTLSYDALGRLSTKSDAVGTTTYSYDTLGRVTSVDGPWADDTISYTYDALGRQTALSVNGTTQASYAYDSLDRLTGVTSGSNTFGYAYNGASSQLTQMTLPGGATTNYAYDTMQRLTEVQSMKSDATTNIADFDYTYNTRDVRTSVEKTIGGGSTQTVAYTYDDIDQLTRELSSEPTPALDREYSYDAMGNRTASSVSGASTSYTANNLNQITQTSIGGTNTAIVYDANGNMVAQGAKTFGYSDADQLTSVVIPNDKKSEFVYDSDGRKRISREYSWDAGTSAWVQSDETRFVYDGMDLVQERDAQGNVKASYVRDGNIGGVLSMTNADGTFFYHYDGSGNVVALTDANQNIVAQYAYDAFGNTLSASGAQADKNPFRFSSKYYDADTGLYDYGYRHYDSQLGRWINRDPIREEGGLNLYGMVGNNPVNAVDADGLRPITTRDIGRLKTLYRRRGSISLKTINNSVRAIKAAIAAVPNGWNDPASLRAIWWSIDNLGNSAYGFDGELLFNYPVGDMGKGNKCNRFVGDAYAEGAGIGYNSELTSAGFPVRGTLNKTPPSANALGDASQDIDNFPVVKVPRVGDLVAFGAIGDGSGHVTLNLGGGLLIYAGAGAVKIGTFGMNQKGHQSAVYRRYVP